MQAHLMHTVSIYIIHDNPAGISQPLHGAAMLYAKPFVTVVLGSQNDRRKLDRTQKATGLTLEPSPPRGSGQRGASGRGDRP